MSVIRRMVIEYTEFAPGELVHLVRNVYMPLKIFEVTLFIPPLAPSWRAKITLKGFGSQLFNVTDFIPVNETGAVEEHEDVLVVGNDRVHGISSRGASPVQAPIRTNGQSMDGRSVSMPK